MIYRLPSRSSRKYRGKYPDRINSFSGWHRGCYHIETNDGARYVLYDVIFTPSAIRGRFVGQNLEDLLCNADAEDFVRVRDYACSDMPLHVYAGIVFMSRLVSLLRYGAKGDDTAGYSALVCGR